jgi:GDPmannose 4,6-dehydratase
MTEIRTALITGVTGQDGSHLVELLAGKGYRIVGTTRVLVRDVPVGDTCSPMERVAWDGTDQDTLDRIFAHYAPDECYNLAAYTSGAGMYDDPVAIGSMNGLAVVRVLEAIRRHAPGTRLVQASSSEVFGRVASSPQNESTPRIPRSPYGAAKLYADSMVDIYRARYGVFACSAILFNHEGPRRRLDFVTRKVTRAAAAISLGLEQQLPMGNLDARRDWGYAGDFVRAMWLMAQTPVPADYVVATGITHSVRDLCECAFAHVGLDYRDYVSEDSSALRPAEPVPLVGDARKARSELGWVPEIMFKRMIEMMVDNDLAQLRAKGELKGVE